MHEERIDIITGQRKQRYPMSLTGGRFISPQSQCIDKETTNNTARSSLPTMQMRKLGTAKDSKLFTYSYNSRDYNPDVYTLPVRQMSGNRNHNKDKTSLINASKYTFNLINHAEHTQNVSKWSETKKHCPVSKFTELGRSFAPNYTKDYMRSPMSHHKKSSLCGAICQIQHSYGPNRFFRKYK